MNPRRGPSREVTDTWKPYAENGQHYLEKAEDALVLTAHDANAKAVASHAVLAAIAYADAITVQRGGKINSQDHSRQPELLEQLLGKDADAKQITRLRRILARKNEAQYGGTRWRYDDAEDFLEQARRFASWAKTVLHQFGEP